MIRFRALSFLLVTSALMVSGGYYFSVKVPPTKLDDQTLLLLPDLSIHAFKLIEYNEKGQLAKQVVSDQVTHVPDKNQYFLHEPHIHFRGNEGSFYYLFSNHAKTLQGFEKMIFNGHVILEQPQTKASQAFSMLTETLTYVPKKEQAFTNTPVQFTQIGHIVHANGMQADLKTNHIKLQNAKAELQPTHA